MPTPSRRDAFDSAVETASFEDKVYGAPFNSNTELLYLPQGHHLDGS